MVAPWGEEVDSGVVSVDDLILRSVEDGIVDRQHGCDAQDLIRTLISGERKTI